MKNESLVRYKVDQEPNSLLKDCYDEVKFLRNKLYETQKDVSALYNALDHSKLSKDALDWFEVVLEDIEFRKHDNCEGCGYGYYCPATHDSPAESDCTCKDAIIIELPNGNSYCDSYYETPEPDYD